MKFNTPITFLALAAMPVFAAVTHRQTSCPSGSYQCFNPDGYTAQVQVCNGGFWIPAALCDPGLHCVQELNGACTCQP
ncbi:hypothetical protein F4806DRAFT_449474 [Annulohypoxylon nitens]|nr:hypothetical protein F4806DRAFT_449474 [Annulohypoxylon nitens]